MSVAARQSRPPRPLDDAIRALPATWFRASPLIYWTDLLASSAVGWLALGVATRASVWARAGWLTLASLALYRAVLFIHEITHRASRDVPAFTAVWNAIVGVPMLIPSFLYEQVHTDHHRQRCYGTPADPEYVPYGRRSPLLLVTSVLASLFVPLALVIRFAVVAPLAWIVPPLRRWVSSHASALVINHRYVRHAPISSAGRTQEAAAAAMVYTGGVLWWMGRLSGVWIENWLIVGVSVSAINAVRTLAAHRYDIDHDEVSMTEQLLDSCTIAPGRGVTGRAASAIGGVVHALLAPVGLRYHALHHWIPSLPYHNLGRAHRLLTATLRADAPYHATAARSVATVIGDLVRRARAQGRGRF